MIKALVAGGAILLSSSALLLARAADAVPELSTDRPDEATGTTVVTPGYVLWETGFKFSRDDEDGTRTDDVDILDSLFRIGVAEKLELRLSVAGKWQETTTGGVDSRSRGIGDPELGVKLRLLDEQGRAPSIAVIVATTLPIGDNKFSSDRADPSAILAFLHLLTDDLGLTWNLGLKAKTSRDSTGQKETDSVLTYAATLGLAPDPRLSPYLEVFGESPEGGSTSLSVGVGLLSLLRPNLQLDLSGAFGATDSANDWSLGAGLSVRFPR